MRLLEVDPVKNDWKHILEEGASDVAEQVEDHHYVGNKVGDQVDGHRKEQSLGNGCRVGREDHIDAPRACCGAEDLLVGNLVVAFLLEFFVENLQGHEDLQRVAEQERHSVERRGHQLNIIFLKDEFVSSPCRLLPTPPTHLDVE